MIGIGIDTGGTCTDAVVYDTEKHEVLSRGKTVTTKRDLKIGILKALSELDPEAIKKAEYVSLSTTLATNACVEDLGCRAKLIFIGVKEKAVARMAGEYGLPPVSEIFFMEGDAGRIDPAEREPDWEAFEARLSELKGYDAVAAVQMNPEYNGGAFERKVAEIVREKLGIPCVKGYELYQEINVQRRGATALLNARLIPIMEGFFRSIEESMHEIGIDLPIVVVKSNGSIMTREYAAERPVDTLLCGPAASVMGALELLGGQEGLVCDIGGTTTDVAMVRNGTPVSSSLGINIGRWRTMVKGISIDTFALGGDTAVEYHNGELFLMNRRAVPLCSLATEFPVVRTKLAALMRRGLSFGYPAQDFFVLAHEPSHIENYSERDRKIIEALREEPRGFEELANIVGVSPYILKVGRLEDEGIVMRGGITPTDAMHYLGDFTGYDRKASELALRYLSALMAKPAVKICETIYSMARERLYVNLSKILIERESGEKLSESEALALEKLTKLLYKRDENHEKSRFADVGINAKIPLIGIGGPSEILIGQVPGLLGTEAKYPAHKDIANAIGATVGRMSSSYTVRIVPDNFRNWGSTYYVVGGSDIEGFDVYDDAKRRAEEIARARVLDIIDKEGSSKMPEIKVDIEEDFFNAGGGKSVFVTTLVTAKVDSYLSI